MTKIKHLSNIIVVIAIFLASCSKENTVEDTIEGEFLTFKTKTAGNGTVLYSKWLPSQFPNSSQNSSEIADLPLIKNKFFDPQKDLMMVYGRRNNIFTLPVTMPQDAESYSVELIPVTNGTLIRLRVTSLLLDPLQDIFFNPNFNAAFRIVIVPGEKLLPMKSGRHRDYQKMTYDELAAHFGLSG